jgi:predicted dithiol-disulfide oxidoreductase (DUF899 family)
MSTRTVDNPKVVSREQWLAARKRLLAKEKQLTRERDAIAAERRRSSIRRAAAKPLPICSLAGAS